MEFILRYVVYAGFNEYHIYRITRWMEKSSIKKEIAHIKKISFQYKRNLECHEHYIKSAMFESNIPIAISASTMERILTGKTLKFLVRRFS